MAGSATKKSDLTLEIKNMNFPKRRIEEMLAHFMLMAFSQDEEQALQLLRILKEKM